MRRSQTTDDTPSVAVNVTVDLSGSDTQTPARYQLPKTIRPKPAPLPPGVNTKKWRQTSADLCRMAYDSSPWWLRRRWMALLLTSIGVPPQEAAKLIGVSLSSVNNWRRAYDVVGPNGINDRCKPGGRTWSCETYKAPTMVAQNPPQRRLCSERPASITTSVEFDDDRSVQARCVKTSILFDGKSIYSVS